MALPPPFPTGWMSDSLVHEPKLQTALNELGRQPLYAQAGFAVADLSGSVSRYAGWNLDKHRFSGSVLKITVLFAALQLLERLKLAAKGLKEDVIFKTVKAAWYPLVARSVGGESNFPQ